MDAARYAEECSKSMPCSRSSDRPHLRESCSLGAEPRCGLTAAAVTASIIDLTHDGLGVATLDGRRVFVAGALPGERVEILLRKRRRKHVEAELVRVLDLLRTA